MKELNPSLNPHCNSHISLVFLEIDVKTDYFCVYIYPAGLFTGCCVALIAAIIVSVHARNLLEHRGGMQYMTNIFPLYRYFT